LPIRKEARNPAGIRPAGKFGLHRAPRQDDASGRHCYSGGFSVLASGEGRQTGHRLDSSQPALKLAAEGAAANGVADNCRFVRCDVFEELDRLARTNERFERRYLRSAAFAPSPPKDLEVAARAYRKLRTDGGSRRRSGRIPDARFLLVQYFA